MIVTLEIHRAELERQLPTLAARCALAAFWAGGPDSTCLYAQAYRAALVELDDVTAALAVTR